MLFSDLRVSASLRVKVLVLVEAARVPSQQSAFTPFLHSRGFALRGCFYVVFTQPDLRCPLYLI